MSRGYTPAGVEAWNSIRALDYLSTRPEVDPTKFGMTGRSGGGAYTWWTAALDERVACAVPWRASPTCRTTSADGTIEGHCDCMFRTNTIAGILRSRGTGRAATAADLHSDKDTIFPLDA